MCKQVEAAFSYEERRAAQAIDRIAKEALTCSKVNEELQAAAIASDDMLEATLSELGAVRKQLAAALQAYRSVSELAEVESRKKQHYKINMYRAMYGLPLLPMNSGPVRETSEGLEAP